MDQNQFNENELQKAIDDITKTATDNGMTMGAVPDFGTIPQPEPTPILNETEAAPVMDGPMVAPIMPAPEALSMPVEPEAMAAVAPSAPVETTVATEPKVEAPEVEEKKASYGNPDIVWVKESALKELFPLMDKLEAEPEKKFHIYKDMIEIDHDKGMIEPAYKVAQQIKDDGKRAEALLYVIELIDNLGV